ncbi:MAG TPA: magnesium transporter CorA family protein [Candidatus Aphodocola excrementigallinarum]|uniref:Magnesium transporter CorA family protein n=1 Tax=Candidatus Aphodocola excrementigallinarum TaxID=2840670 RepID=A0A9D1LID6_9FIRM|nr:magnesium transporter CorA family protein [Candidatus Aphodocola excrementigallinarum]
MINIYTTDANKKLKELKNLQKECWIDLINPSLEEIKEISNKTNTDLDLLTKLLDDEELPRIEIGDNATLIVVDTPYVTDTNYKHKYNTDPLGLIINNDGYFITISPKEQTLFNDFKNNKVREFNIKKRTKFVIQILLKTASVYQRELKAINEYINEKEKTLHKSTNNKRLIELLNVEKTLVYFSTSLKANDVVLEKLAKGNVLTMYEDDTDLLEDAMIENKQAIEMANIYREILTSMTDTYATIISNNLNDVMKFLAGITIVFSIPTMVASFIGMNVPLGKIGTSSLSFILIIAFSFVLSIIIAIILKKKNML